MDSFSEHLTICVVILHYNDEDMTTRYTNNLLSLDWSNTERHIVIVDNASPDGSGYALNQTFKSTDDVDIILSDTNEGFARGNNLGIRHSADKYNPDLIIVSNNDITICDTDFIQVLMKIYKDTSFDVFGPDIYSVYRNYHQSPIRKHHLNVDDLNKKISNIDKTLRKLRILDKLNLYDPLRNIKRLFRPTYPSVPDHDHYQENVVLQGAFFVLSRGYLQAYPDGLYPETFLYMEEDILNYRISRKNLKAVYDPTLKVEHMEGAATRKKSGDRCKKYIFELEQTRLSCLEMIKYISS